MGNVFVLLRVRLGTSFVLHRYLPIVYYNNDLSFYNLDNFLYYKRNAILSKSHVHAYLRFAN